MVQIIDLDGNLTRALVAIKELRARCIREGWGAPNLTQALSFASVIDYEAARQANRVAEWQKRWDLGRELASDVIDEGATT